MPVSEPLALARVNEHTASAQAINAAQSTQQLVVSFPPIGTPEFVHWARHDSVSGHANNALQLLAVVFLDDPHQLLAMLTQVRRRLHAIVELER